MDKAHRENSTHLRSYNSYQLPASTANPNQSSYPKMAPHRYNYA